MKRRMTSTTVYLPADDIERLKRWSKRTRVPFAALVRTGVRRVLKDLDSEPVAEAGVSTREITR